MEGMDADQEKISRNSGKFEGAERPHMMFFTSSWTPRRLSHFFLTARAVCATELGI
jgi:hypothetical protein